SRRAREAPSSIRMFSNFFSVELVLDMFFSHVRGSIRKIVQTALPNQRFRWAGVACDSGAAAQDSYQQLDQQSCKSRTNGSRLSTAS
ncbi:hypothetical protein KC845_03795, partial [Candidatus Kaiserbacteria bacterium]|nr:hypothetical protein [Candidatus Kaiserbacteria bacterium]